MSSSAAMGISVFVTAPFVLNSLTIESAGAGAVARAIPPNTNARYTGAPVKQNTIANTPVTSAKVPSDCANVVITSAFPKLLILLKTSSVPIMIPTVHSRMWISVSYHWALISSSDISENAYGPTTIPVISQPRIAGSLSLLTSFPATNASAIDNSHFNTAIALFPFHYA